VPHHIHSTLFGAFNASISLGPNSYSLLLYHSTAARVSMH